MTEPTDPSQLDAYALLSRPTLELTEPEVKAIIANLRERRFISLSTGKPDKVAKPKAPNAKPTAAEKAAATKALLASLDLKV